MIRLLSPDHERALRDQQTWIDNPFAGRDARRDRKRRHLTKSITWMALVMIGIGAGAVFGIGKLLTAFGSIPWYLSGDWLLALFIIVSGVHVWFVGSTSQRGTLLLLGREANANTLMHLLTLPISTFQIVLETGVYPWLAAMRISLLMLPFYVFVAAMEKISWLDLGMLYVVFALAAISFPILRRPGLGDLTPTVTAASARPQAAAIAAASAQNGKSGQNASGASGGWLSLAFTLPMMSVLVAFVSGRGVGGMHAILGPYIPDNLLTLMPTSMLSWPLLMARGALTPLNWFGWGVPPILFCVPIIGIHRYLQVVRTAEYLQVGNYRDLALLPTYIPRRKLEGYVRYATFLVISGYAWKWAVWDGGINFGFGARTGSAPGLSTFAYGLCFLMAWTVIIRVSLFVTWIRSDCTKRFRLATRKLTFKRVSWFLVQPVLFAVAYFMVCCCLSRTFALGTSIALIFGKMLALTVVSGMLCFGADSVLGTFSVLPRLLIPFGALAGFNSYHIPMARTLGFLSPTLGLLSVLNPQSIGLASFYTGTSWFNWIVLGGSVGLILSLIGVPILSNMIKKSTLDEGSLALDPTLYGTEIFQDETTAMADPKQKDDTPLVLRLVQVVQRFGDNAVSTRELRSRLRGKLDNSTLRNFGLLAVILSVGVFQGAPQVVELFGGSLSIQLFGRINNPALQTISQICICWFIVLAIISIISGFAAIRTFAIEREKSTLGFVLLTPMSSGAIVRGKTAGVLLSTSVYALGIVIWTLVLCCSLSPTIGVRAIVGWLAVTSLCGLVFVTIGMFSVAVGAVLSRFTINPGCWSFSMVVLVQVVANGGRYLVGYIGSLMDAYGIAGRDLLYIFIIFCFAVLICSYAAAVMSLNRMRKGDLSFGTSKKDN